MKLFTLFSLCLLCGFCATRSFANAPLNKVQTKSFLENGLEPKTDYADIAAATCTTAPTFTISDINSTTAQIKLDPYSYAYGLNIDIYKGSTFFKNTNANPGSTICLPYPAGAPTTYNVFVYGQCILANGPTPVSTASFKNRAAYCTNAGGRNPEWIKKITLNTINQTTTSGGGYIDYTCDRTNLLPGNVYSLYWTAGYTAPTFPVSGISIWIDYNRDGDFADAGETIFQKIYSTAGPNLVKFIVPAKAYLGITTMRVALSSSTFLPSPCTAYLSAAGQVQDYSVVIGSGIGRVGVAEELELELAPNPTSDVTLVHATLPQGAESANVTVTDLQGRQVWSAANVAASAGRIEGFAVPVNNLKPGVYMLRVEAAGMQKTVRLSVQ